MIYPLQRSEKVRQRAAARRTLVVENHRIESEAWITKRDDCQ